MTTRLTLALLVVCGAASVSRAEDGNGKALPKVLLLGDSIRLSYTELVTQQLDGKAVVVSHKANGGDSANTLSHLTEWAIKVQPDIIHFTPSLPKTRSGKIMRRILRKIAEKEFGALGDISTLADPSVVEALIEGRKQR